MLDVATLKYTPLWAGHKVTQIEYAPDGSWLAAADANGIVVLDAAGDELAERAGALDDGVARRRTGSRCSIRRRSTCSSSISRRIAWHDYAVTLPPRGVLIAAHYRADALEVDSSAGVLHVRRSRAAVDDAARRARFRVRGEPRATAST